MAQQFFEELSRCLRKEQIESYNKEDRRLEIFLHGQPVLSVSPGNEVFLLPAGSKNPEANELYHRVAIAADSAFEYVEAMENTPLLRARGLENKFHLLADFGGAVLAGRERAAGQGYEFVTWIWDYEKVGVSHGHYYEDDFAGAKRDFAVRSGLIPKASLFSNEELTEIYLYLGEREKALQTAERLATSRLWAVAGPTQVRPMSFFEDPNLREFLLEPESLRRIREAAFIDDGSLIRK